MDNLAVEFRTALRNSSRGSTARPRRVFKSKNSSVVFRIHLRKKNSSCLLQSGSSEEKKNKKSFSPLSLHNGDEMKSFQRTGLTPVTRVENSAEEKWDEVCTVRVRRCDTLVDEK